MNRLLHPLATLLAPFAFALCGLSALAGDYYVVPAGTAGNTPTSPYDSWATAANSIADALAALPSDTDPATIRVAPGIYAVAEQMIPSRQNVEIRSDDGSGHLARETTILDGGFRNAADCDSTNRFFQISKNNFALRGFTLRNSCAAYEKQFGGGAVYISSGIKGVTLDSCTFTNCNAFFVVPKNNVQSNSGGAVSVHYDSANCYFENGGDVTLNQYRGNGTSTSLLSLDPGERSAAITTAADAAKDRLFADWTHGNWRPQRKSQLREAGQPLDWMDRNSTDLDGNPRLTDAFGKAFASSALPDLGCYECQDITPYCTLVMVQ